MKPAWLGWAAIFGASLIYAGNFVASRYGLQNAIGANDLAALRFGVAGVVLLPLLWRQGISGLAGIGWGRGLALAAFAGVPFMLLMAWGLSYAPATHGAALIPGAIPIATAFGMWLIAGVRVSAVKLMTLLIIVLGLVLVSGASGAGGMALFGDLLFILAGISWSLYGILLRQWRIDPWAAASVVSVLSLGFLPVYFLLPGPGLGATPLWQILFQGFNQGILNSIVALLLFSFAVRTLGPAKTALGNATVPVLAALMAAPILGEAPGALQWAGIALVIGGVALGAQLEDAPPRQASQ